MEWTLCYKHYVEQAEKAFNIRLINYRKQVKNSNKILMWKDIQDTTETKTQNL